MVENLIYMLERIKHFLAYSEWTIPRIVSGLLTMPNGPEDALRPFAHLLLAEKTWLMRLRAEDSSVVNLEERLSTPQCERLALENQKGYADFVSGVSEHSLAAIVKYKNTKGLHFETPVVDILLHVVIHGAYHRGQIASAIRRAGGTPQNTDYISYLREHPVR